MWGQPPSAVQASKAPPAGTITTFQESSRAGLGTDSRGGGYPHIGLNRTPRILL
jgi:hypothetical protein